MDSERVHEEAEETEEAEEARVEFEAEVEGEREGEEHAVSSGSGREEVDMAMRLVSFV